jgi:hypothetical protein
VADNSADENCVMATQGGDSARSTRGILPWDILFCPCRAWGVEGLEMRVQSRELTARRKEKAEEWRAAADKEVAVAAVFKAAFSMERFLAHAKRRLYYGAAFFPGFWLA